MSEPGEQEAPREAKTRTSNPTVQLIGFVAAGVIAIALLVWAQGVRTAAVRRESFGRGIDGLASALAIPVIETGSRTSENRIARLQSIVESIQRSGKYEAVIVTDPAGNVLATTNTALRGQTLKPMADAKTPTVEKEVDGVVTATTAIENEGGVKVGALQVSAKL